MQYTLLTGGEFFCFALESVSVLQIREDEGKERILSVTQFKVLPSKFNACSLKHPV
jgi:hypothetical protein